MKVRVNYDFTHHELVGENEEFEIAEGTRLGELLRIIDTKLMPAKIRALTLPIKPPYLKAI